MNRPLSPTPHCSSRRINLLSASHANIFNNHGSLELRLTLCQAHPNQHSGSQIQIRNGKVDPCSVRPVGMRSHPFADLDDNLIGHRCSLLLNEQSTANAAPCGTGNSVDVQAIIIARDSDCMSYQWIGFSQHWMVRAPRKIRRMLWSRVFVQDKAKPICWPLSADGRTQEIVAAPAGLGNSVLFFLRQAAVRGSKDTRRSERQHLRRMHRPEQRNNCRGSVPRGGKARNTGNVHFVPTDARLKDPRKYSESEPCTRRVVHAGRRYAALILSAITLAGCSKTPVSVSSTDNQEIQVAELFTHKGVTVFRFNDAGRWVYFTSKATDATASYVEHCGKGCTRTETVETRGEWATHAGGRR